MWLSRLFRGCKKNSLKERVTAQKMALAGQIPQVIFQCNRKFKNDKKCRTPHLTEDELIANTTVMMRTLCDTTELEVEQSRLLTEMDAVAKMVKRIVAENQTVATDQGKTRFAETNWLPGMNQQRTGTKRHPRRFPTGSASGRFICASSAGSKGWIDSARFLMGNFRRRCLSMPLSTLRLLSCFRSE